MRNNATKRLYKGPENSSGYLTVGDKFVRWDTLERRLVLSDTCVFYNDSWSTRNDESLLFRMAMVATGKRKDEEMACDFTPEQVAQLGFLSRPNVELFGRDILA